MHSSTRKISGDDPGDVLEEAMRLYGPLVRDNVDIEAVGSDEARRRIVGEVLMSRGDARAFVLGRILTRG